VASSLESDADRHSLGDLRQGNLTLSKLIQLLKPSVIPALPYSHRDAVELQPSPTVKEGKESKAVPVLN
jgi:hypothetical protein